MSHIPDGNRGQVRTLRSFALSLFDDLDCSGFGLALSLIIGRDVSLNTCYKILSKRSRCNHGYRLELRL
jgi:hypothetical protein